MDKALLNRALRHFSSLSLNQALRHFSSPSLNEKPLPKDVQVEVNDIKLLITSILKMSDGIVSQLVWYTDENEVALMADDAACMLQDFVMKQTRIASFYRVKLIFYYYKVVLRLRRLRLYLTKIKDELSLSENIYMEIEKTKKGLAEKRQEGVPVDPFNFSENGIQMFMHEASVDPTNEKFEALVAIGEKIIQQCNYSVEMVKIAGKLLRIRPQQRYWQALVDSDILCNRSGFSLQDTNFNVLPWRVKAFHAYDLLFPGKGVFKEHLVDLWIAEGIASSSVEIEEYFFGLQENECYFDRQKEGRFLSHSSFTEAISKPYILKMRANSNETIPNKCRYLSLICDENTKMLPPANIFKDNRLHTLLLVSEYSYAPQTYGFEEKIGITHLREDTLSCLVHLRVLDLSCSEIKKLPDSIGKLSRLLYLNLSKTNIEEIPKSVGNLWTLQVLNLSNCEELLAISSSISKLERLIKLDLEGCLSLCELPDGMHLLKKLKHLNILGCPLLSCMPQQMGILTQLKFLPRFIVSSEEGKSITELQSLQKLKGELRIENLCKVLDPQDAVKVHLEEKIDVAFVALDWSCFNFTDIDNVDGPKVLDNLRPSSLIQKFEVLSYPGKIWPRRYFERFMALRDIRLINCKEVNTLPPLGQLPCVRFIEIRGLDAVTTFDVFFYGNTLQHVFPKLLEFTISQMPNLETWLWPDFFSGEVKPFPILQKLNIIQCPKLKALHFKFPCVHNLTLSLNNRSLYTSPRSLKGLSQCLKKLTIRLCYELISTSSCVGLECLSNLEELNVSECDQLTSLPDGILSQVGYLRTLRINCCSNLEHLPDWLLNVTPAMTVTISDCPKLMKNKT